MRAQLRLLEYLVHMWDVNEKDFHVDAHTLTIDIEDIILNRTILSWIMGESHR
jgi:hypothetical protein